MKQFLKHLLVLFTDFKNFGPLICVGIPLFLYTLITIKKRKRWEIALLLLSILSLLLLTLGGEGYVRYILTLYPLIIGAVVYYGWELIRKRDKILKIFAFLILFVLIGLNYAQNSHYYGFYWRYKVAGSEKYFPEQLLNFIQKIQDTEAGEKILIYSRWFLFYYHIDKNGLDFRNPEMNLFYVQEEKSSALDVLKNKIKIKYILVQRSTITELPLTEPFSEILLYDCDLLIQENGLELYRLRDSDLDKKDLERYFINESLIQNGSFEIWSQGPSTNPDFFEEGDNILKSMIAQEHKDVLLGLYSVKITGDNFNFVQDMPGFEKYRGTKITCFAWVKTNVADKYRIQIYDGFDSSYSLRHSGKGGWELLQANHTINSSAKFVKLRIIQADKTGRTDDIVFVDGALVVEGDWNTFYLYKTSKGN